MNQSTKPTRQKLGETRGESVWFCTLSNPLPLYYINRLVGNYLSSSTIFTKQFTNKKNTKLKAFQLRRKRKRKDEFKEQSMVSGSNHRSRGGLQRPIRTMPVELPYSICESTYPKQREIRCSGEQVLFFVHRRRCLL